MAEPELAVVAGGWPRPQERPSVMLVDDDLATAEMYQLGLEHLGFRVALESSGGALLAALQDGLPDIVVLDWDLPDTNGDELLAKLRDNPRTAALPAFILSNFTRASMGWQIDKVFQAGALAWLEKTQTPPAILAAKLAEALGKRPPRRTWPTLP